MTLSDVAARTALSRAAISLRGKGERGQGFPAPVARITSESPLDLGRCCALDAGAGSQASEVLRARVMKEANLVANRFRRGELVKQFEKRAAELERQGHVNREVTA